MGDPDDDQFACQHENIDMTRLLLESKAIPLCFDSISKITPLHIAATKGNAELCELLLVHGADMNAADKDGWTPIFWAIQQGHKHLVKSMISYGDEEAVNKLLSHRDKRGWRPPLFERAVLLEHLASIDMNADEVEVHKVADGSVSADNMNTANVQR